MTAPEEITSAELEAEAEALAHEVLGPAATRADAWKRVRAGDFAGTFFAARISQIFWLLGASEPLPHAAE